LVKVNKGEAFPCDLIIISSSEKEGLCYVETSSLDGETNLKDKQAPKETLIYNNPDWITTLKGEIECEGISFI
jgi:P-type E1-E2 ATPase